jgi:hypothetical protein
MLAAFTPAAVSARLRLTHWHKQVHLLILDPIIEREHAVNLETIYYVGQTLAVLAILGSLVYVAIQTRQNASVMRAKAVWDAQMSFVEINEQQMDGGPISQLTFKALNDPDNLNDFERYRLHRLMRGVFQRLEAQFALYTNGILEQEVWHLRRGYAAALLNNQLINKIWATEQNNSMFTRAFVTEIESARHANTVAFIGIETPAENPH